MKLAPTLGASAYAVHRRVVIAVVVASLFEIVPTFLIRANVPTIAKVQPYTPLELAGRDLYVAKVVTVVTRK